MNRTLKFLQRPSLSVVSTLLMLVSPGCQDVSEEGSVTDQEVGDPTASLDASESPFAELDQSVRDQIAQGERYDYWVSAMDPFITENQNWTYTFDRTSFLASLVSARPEVVAYYEGTGSVTDDTDVIDELINGLPVVNQFALEQYEEMTASGSVAPPSVYGSWQWYGYKRCYTGSDSDKMIAWMSTGGAVLTLTGIGTVPGGVLVLLAAGAQVYDSYYGGFCLTITWSTNVGLSRP